MLLRGFLMVSSTDRMRQAASDAAVRALILTIDGSHTQAVKLSAMSSLLMSTPYQTPPCDERRNTGGINHGGRDAELDLAGGSRFLPERVWRAAC